jgi:hypothetical protein
MSYNWAGDVIFRDTVIPDKRFVIGSLERGVPTDIREWLQPSNAEDKSRVLETALERMPGLPKSSRVGEFDRRAHMIWDFVARHVRYNLDKDRRGYDDFWLFAEETLCLAIGDCEDSSILLASLLIAAGISPYVVRVALGNVYAKGRLLGSHAWVVYQDEGGVWRLLESTLDAVPPYLPPAEAFSRPNAPRTYRPDFCFNGDHLWWIRPPADPRLRAPLGIHDYMQRQVRSGIVHAGMTSAFHQQFHEQYRGE